MQPAQRTLLIIGVLSISAAVSYVLTGADLVARVPPEPSAHASDPVTFHTAEGLRVVGDWREPPGAAVAVILAHRLRATRHSSTARADFLQAAGYATLAVDLPAHGDSEGDKVGYGAREAPALHAAVAWVRQRRPGVCVVVHGVALGAAAAVLAEPELAADALILEALYPSVEAAVEHRLRLRYGAAGPYLTPLFMWQIDRRLDLDDRARYPAANLPSIDVPVFVIAASEDPRTPSSDSLLMYGAIAAPKSVWLVGGAGHHDLYAFRPEEYRRRVLAFLGGPACAAAG